MSHLKIYNIQFIRGILAVWVMTKKKEAVIFLMEKEPSKPHFDGQLKIMKYA